MSKPDLLKCPFCGSEVVWIDTSKNFMAERFICAARCKNPRCVARITFWNHNFSRSQFAKKFNHRVSRMVRQESLFEE